MSAPTNQATHCHVMAKPSSSVCNLDCSYCFYLEKEHLYPERKKNWKMSDETLEIYVKQYIEAQGTEDIEFAWQGGEPTLLGIDFFKKAISLQNKYKKNHRVFNAFQTNGILLNDEWCQFFKENNFLIGLSIDGPQELHDTYRVNRSGKPSHNKVKDAVKLLKKHGVEFNTLTVINDKNVKHPVRVYEYLKSIGSTYMQFIPLVERKATEATEEGLYLIQPDFQYEANVIPMSVKPSEYGDFLNDIFDCWIKKDVGRIFVNMFDTTLATWCNHPASLCVFSETCGHALVLEANGDTYNCDHFVYPEHLLGNIHNTNIRDMNQSEQAVNFGLEKKTKLTEQCKKCEFLFACNGGCPKHRFITSEAGQPGHNYFCEGFAKYFKHTESRMKMMRDLVNQRRPAAEVMMQLHQQNINFQQGNIGRNDLCPCDSNKKYKKCCGLHQ